MKVISQNTAFGGTLSSEWPAAPLACGASRLGQRRNRWHGSHADPYLESSRHSVHIGVDADDCGA
jgi:hypothetical protein